MTKPVVQAEGPKIGARIRASRRRRGLTLSQLSEATLLDKSFLSRLERDVVSVSVASLVKICRVLGIRPGDLFDPPRTLLVRAGQGPNVNFGGEGVHETLLSRGLGGQLMVLASRIAPSGHSGAELYSLDTDVTFVTVVAGSLEVRIEAEPHRLEVGDSLTFDSRRPHSWRNPGLVTAQVLWVSTPHS